MKTWRLLDTGARTALDNIAIDSALLKARSLDNSPDTLRFLQYSPAAALVGYFQSTGQEIRMDFCRERGIEVQRRITGGGAIYFDESHLGWEIVAHRSDFGFRLDDASRRISAGVIAGLRRLGIAAAFRPRNDIEVNGRKISGTGGVIEGDALLFQGTLLLDLDIESMIKALRIPTEKLSERGLSSIRERVTSLREELGSLPPMPEVKEAIRQGFAESLGIDFEAAPMTDEEEGLYRQLREEHASREWLDLVAEPPTDHVILRSALRVKGGLIRTAVSIDSRRRILKYALVTGDFFMSPGRALFDLEAALKNTPIDSVSRVIEDFFAREQPVMLGIRPADFCAAIEAAVEKIGLARYGIGLGEANSVFTVNGGFAAASDSCAVLLLPYCAKLIDCRFRDEDGCDQCGKCSVGSAYGLAAELGLQAITIHNYEHLEQTLNECRENGIGSYVGCCCEAFFVKHQRTFRDAGLPAVLIDIEKQTCYELGSEERAYAGRFENQTELKLDLLKKVLGNLGGAKVASM